MSPQLELELPRDPSAPGRARRALAQFAGDRLCREQLDTVKLLATELVTNAVLHGHGMILLKARLSKHLIRVEVIDEGAGIGRAEPDRTFAGFGGWGLALVEAEASRWGTLEGAAHVWFELTRPGARVYSS